MFWLTKSTVQFFGPPNFRWQSVWSTKLQMAKCLVDQKAKFNFLVHQTSDGKVFGLPNFRWQSVWSTKLQMAKCLVYQTTNGKVFGGPKSKV
jgi:hypothetical protein